MTLRETLRDYCKLDVDEDRALAILGGVRMDMGSNVAESQVVAAIVWASRQKNAKMFRPSIPELRDFIKGHQRSQHTADAPEIVKCSFCGGTGWAAFSGWERRQRPELPSESFPCCCRAGLRRQGRYPKGIVGHDGRVYRTSADMARYAQEMGKIHCELQRETPPQPTAKAVVVEEGMPF